MVGSSLFKTGGEYEISDSSEETFLFFPYNSFGHCYDHY
jgi:hypothetical protein